jgi:CheY-like chemotaxis protein
LEASFPIRVLIVEDDPAVAERLSGACTGATGQTVEVSVAADAAAAEEHLAQGDLSLIIHDLAGGFGLLREITEDHPGVPVILVAALDDPTAAAELLAAGRQEDIFGTDTEEPMVAFVPEHDTDKAADLAAATVARIAEVASLPLDLAPGLELSTGQKRALQIYARRTGAATAEVTGLSGGLSGAVTVIVDTADASGMQTGHVVGKLAPVKTVPGAVDGYENAIPDLPAGLGAGLAGVVSAGAGGTGAVFFRLADDFSRTWFECLGGSPADAARACSRLHERFADRYPDAPRERLTVGAIRRAIVSDAEMSEAVAPPPDLSHLEDVEIEVARGIQHRDLHGLNVLVSDSSEPLLIDYDNYDAANCCLDPVTLELSTVFHRDEGAQTARKGWPSAEQARAWFDLDAYLEGCPYPEAIRACRAWAEEAAGSEEELAATVLSAALRQFWFENTDKEIAAALVSAGEKRLGG